MSTYVSRKAMCSKLHHGIIYSFVLPVEQWQTEHLDCILITGNNLYQTIKSPHDYLLVSDIPNFIAEFGGYYKVTTSSELFWIHI